MDNFKSIYGACATVYINYDKKIEDLAIMLQEKMELPEFRIENDEYEQYGLIAYVETFGLEIELKKIDNKTKNFKYDYKLQAVTTDSFQEIAKNCMHDLSLWLARYTATVCNMKTMAINKEENVCYNFCYSTSSYSCDITLSELEN